MAFIRKVKTKSGATAVQIAYSSYGKIVRIEHIGSAHNPSDLETLINLAKKKLQDRQLSLFEPTSETKTILPVVEAFRQRHGLVGITVVADAGMLSANNLESLNAAGYTYIVGSRMNKIPYDIAKYQKTKVLKDNQIITSKTAIDGQCIIYQYRKKRAALDRRNIDKQIEKAEKIVNGIASTKRAKFLSVTTKDKQLNQALIDKAKALVGIKGYITNLPLSEVSNQKVIAYYHQLWHVEQSFRMSKSDLKARPIFHHKREAIEAHLTVVMASCSNSKKYGKSFRYIFETNS